MKEEMIMKKNWRSREKILVSVVLPCLNEEKTVGFCIKNAKQGIRKIKGEVIVVDNGSSDKSVDVASKSGARVIIETQRGYGAALTKGILSARGNIIILADADLSYEVERLQPFIEAIKAGADVVIGNRFAGKIEKGAMPRLHRYVGNPVLTKIANILFQTNLGDYHCGIRALRKSIVEKLDLRSKGMEFASEMIVKASLQGLSIQEVPVNYNVDGREGVSHLRSFHDGWRHLKFLMMYSPNWIFFYPALVIICLSIILLGIMIFKSLTIGRIEFGVHTMLVTSAFLIIGYQLFLWSICSHIFAQGVGLMFKTPKLLRLALSIKTEWLMLCGSICCVIGILGANMVFLQWKSQGFGRLNPSDTFKIFIPSVSIVILGIQMIFSVFFLELLKIKTNTAKDI